MGGRSAAAVIFHILSRLFIVSPHLPLALMAFLSTGVVLRPPCIRCMNCTGV